MTEKKPRWTCEKCGAPEPKRTIWDGIKGGEIGCENCMEAPKRPEDYPKVEIYNKI
jgi:hypothetical protein